TASPACDPLSLHDALPIWRANPIKTLRRVGRIWVGEFIVARQNFGRRANRRPGRECSGRIRSAEHGKRQARRVVEFEVESLWPRSEEHTSELQSLIKLVCR